MLYQVDESGQAVLITSPSISRRLVQSYYRPTFKIVYKRYNLSLGNYITKAFYKKPYPFYIPQSPYRSVWPFTSKANFNSTGMFASVFRVVKKKI
jgi:hypothetical protein